MNPLVSIRDEYIHGDRFVSIADVAITEDEPGIPEGISARNAIVFCKTDYIERLFTVLRSSTHRYVLITHNSDINIDEEVFRSKPANVVCWFAQNVCFQVEWLVPIPIGIERPRLGRACSDIRLIVEERKQKRKQRNLVYMNFSTHTNRIEREPLLRQFRSSTYVTYGRTGIHFNRYLKAMNEHTFIVSPPGNGVDCHRTWESLYLGKVPIVKAGPGMAAFKKAGLVMVEDWKDVNREMLLGKMVSSTGGGMDSELLLMSYWYKRILGVAHRMLS